jgi:hypothetical protein
MIDDPLALIERYVRHRASREAQLIGFLGEAPSTVDALVSRTYVKLRPDLKIAAAESVLAHLVKLREEGKAQEIDGVWQLTTA